MLKIILSIIVSYFIGSIPFAYILGRIKSIDIRRLGSGNIGATNAFRVLGAGLGTLALALDILKGFFTVVVVADYFMPSEGVISILALRIILGIAAVCGHNWTIFLKFKGGKGVATSLGVLIGLALGVYSLRLCLLFTVLSWLIVFFFSGFVSLASVAAAILFPLLLIFLSGPVELIFLSIVLSVFILYRHKSNIRRLLDKKEHKFQPFNPLKNLLKSRKP
ncbi:MAG: acyl-phosphate glycerol 3-phosphate acyltransferase [Candidatus Omnitrophica bacterium CG11_big_fil_rev_8_21_14_0_20_42_13]|uniref:Glycerol-3-phosphate acyltransferase n=1 Tax=Candidatus Ghiorseimicrobium undicola TaxID=1974746 RepID=A0A2H0LZT3_9BACT|nr:MAG: acyl-phosphate glycerol 3-phosphate acyltransferase [Candidatus Omnitrophica bacterium CG11_big_fil_rev_8_21_14_0_20_42_13]